MLQPSVTTLIRPITFISLFLLTFLCTHVGQAISATKTGTIFSTSTWQFPKVRSDIFEDFYSMYWDALNKSLRFVYWNGTTWEDYTEINSTVLSGATGIGSRTNISAGREYRSVFAFDNQRRLHTLFLAGTDTLSNNQDLIHGVYDGDWNFSLVVDSSSAPLAVSMEIDNNDDVHIAYVEDGIATGNNHLLMYISNVGGSWGSAQEIIETANRANDELHDVYIVAADNGVETILYRRENNQNSHFDSYYLTSSMDSFSLQTRILDGQADAAQYRVGNIDTDDANFIHLVYTDVTNTTVHHTTNESGSWATEPLSSSANTLSRAEDIFITGSTSHILVNSNNGHFFLTGTFGSWSERAIPVIQGEPRDRVAFLPDPARFMIVSENSADFTSYYLGEMSNDNDGLVENASLVTEPVNIVITAHSGTPIDIFDFTITDSGTGDGLPIQARAIDFTLTGTASAIFPDLRFNLTGCTTANGVAPVTGTLSFTDLSLTIADNSSVTCIVQVYWNDTTGAVDSETVALSLDTASGVTVSGTNTTLSTTGGSIGTGDMEVRVVAVPPSAPDLASSSDSGFSNSDNITNVTTPTFTGTAQVGTTIQLSSSIIGEISDSAVTDSSGIWSIALSSPLAHNTRNISATARFGSGAESAPSPALSVTIDTQAPDTTIAPDLSGSSDSGFSSNDNITRNLTPVITGQSEPDTTITVYSDINGMIGTAGGDGSGNWDITSAALSEGNHTLTYVAEDLAGNVSSPSAELHITVDNTPPSAPHSLDLHAPSDSGVSDSDNRTNIITPSISGSAEASTSIEISSSLGGPAGTATTSAAGNWSSVLHPLLPGIHQITAAATDVAGNTSTPSTLLTVLIDTEAPLLLNVPQDIQVQTAQKDATSVFVSWQEPTASDYIDGPVTPIQSTGPANGSNFPVGQTTVVYTAEDNQGNAATQSFTVTVDPYSFPWLIFTPGLVSPNKVKWENPLTN